jgi:hypothetical protein
MKSTYQPIEEEHIIVNTSQQSPAMNAAKIINHISRSNKKKNKK